MKFTKKTQDHIICFIFLIVVPTLAHLSFSWMGFVPSIEGLNLTLSRRLLEGQIPHRDFINIRPIGSTLLYAPFVFFGGDYAHWLSRLFVWFEYACIAWIWTDVIDKSLKKSLPIFQKFMFGMIAFVLTVHYFPVSPWYTTDGLFFLSLGLALCHKGTPTRKFLGYSLMGAAVLCKQTFLPMIPAFLFILKDWRQARFWLAAAIPGIIYAVYLFFAGAFPDAVLQLSARSDEFYSRGIVTYISKRTIPWGILIGYFAMLSTFGKIKTGNLENKVDLQKILGTFMLYAVPFAFSVEMSRNMDTAWSISMALFGITLGATGYFLQKEKEPSVLVRTGVLILLMGWCSSLSSGYNTPALTAGPQVILLIAYGFDAYPPIGEKNLMRKFYLSLLVILFAVSLSSFVIARQKFVFKDQSAPELTKSLDGVFPGARLIKTGSNTYQFLVDFKEAVEKTKGRDFAVIPGLPAYWAKSLHKNPLLIDLAIRPEMSNKHLLVNRVIADLEAHRGKIDLLLEKVEPDCLQHGFFPLTDGGEISRYVRTHFIKASETKFFELYQ